LFNEKESLTILNPKLITETDKSLEIKDADKIIWQWYYYGKERVPENLYFVEINRKDTVVNGKSNVDWYKPNFNDLSIDKPAVFIGGY